MSGRRGEWFAQELREKAGTHRDRPREAAICGRCGVPFTWLTDRDGNVVGVCDCPGAAGIRPLARRAPTAGECGPQPLGAQPLRALKRRAGHAQAATHPWKRPGRRP